MIFTDSLLRRNYGFSQDISIDTESTYYGFPGSKKSAKGSFMGLRNIA